MDPIRGDFTWYTKGLFDPFCTRGIMRCAARQFNIDAGNNLAINVLAVAIATAETSLKILSCVWIATGVIDLIRFANYSYQSFTWKKSAQAFLDRNPIYNAPGIDRDFLDRKLRITGLQGLEQKQAVLDLIFQLREIENSPLRLMSDDRLRAFIDHIADYTCDHHLNHLKEIGGWNYERLSALRENLSSKLMDMHDFLIKLGSRVFNFENWAANGIYNFDHVCWEILTSLDSWKEALQLVSAYSYAFTDKLPSDKIRLNLLEIVMQDLKLTSRSPVGEEIKERKELWGKAMLFWGESREEFQRLLYPIEDQYHGAFWGNHHCDELKVIQDFVLPSMKNKNAWMQVLPVLQENLNGYFLDGPVVRNIAFFEKKKTLFVNVLLHLYRENKIEDNALQELRGQFEEKLETLPEEVKNGRVVTGERLRAFLRHTFSDQLFRENVTSSIRNKEHLFPPGLREELVEFLEQGLPQIIGGEEEIEAFREEVEGFREMRERLREVREPLPEILRAIQAQLRERYNRLRERCVPLREVEAPLREIQECLREVHERLREVERPHYLENV